MQRAHGEAGSDKSSGPAGAFPASEIQELSGLLDELPPWLDSMKAWGEQEAARRRIERALHLCLTIRRSIIYLGYDPTPPAIGRVTSGLGKEPTEPGEIEVHREPKDLTDDEADALGLVHDAGMTISTLRLRARDRRKLSDEDAKKRNDFFEAAKGRLSEIAKSLHAYCQNGQQVGANDPPHNAMDGEARALAVFVKHPEWTHKKIAEAAGVNRGQLYRYKKYQAARKIAREQGKASLPRGHKTPDGDLDAYE
ncbi:MAG: hypothetical protein FJ280_17420 [Planctomycetes bacterium]|nr:hypothetical protein [Planctomycetota bacterium]